jgi:uncharacterized membrane protein
MNKARFAQFSLKAGPLLAWLLLLVGLGFCLTIAPLVTIVSSAIGLILILGGNWTRRYLERWARCDQEAIVLPEDRSR